MFEPILMVYFWLKCKKITPPEPLWFVVVGENSKRRLGGGVTKIWNVQQKFLGVGVVLNSQHLCVTLADISVFRCSQTSLVKGNSVRCTRRLYSVMFGDNRSLVSPWPWKDSKVWTGVAPEVNLRERTSHMTLQRTNKAALFSPTKKTCPVKKIFLTRMHSSRMRTARSSSRRGCVGGLHQVPPPPVDRVTDRCKHITLPQTGVRIQKTFLRKVMTRMRSIRMRTDRCSSRLLGAVSVRHPFVNRMTDACENITLPQLHCGRKYDFSVDML